MHQITCCAAFVRLVFAIVDFYERGRGQMERGRGRGRGQGQVFWPRGRGLNEDLTSLKPTEVVSIPRSSFQRVSHNNYLSKSVRFNTVLRRHHPNTWQFVECMRQEQANTEFLPARRYASAGLCDSDVSVRLSVRPSVCLSHAGIVPSRAKAGS